MCRKCAASTGHAEDDEDATLDRNVIENVTKFHNWEISLAL